MPNVSDKERDVEFEPLAWKTHQILTLYGERSAAELRCCSWVVVSGTALSS
jgi:hypothetical protein